ncbi:MAG TPA: lipoprotein [Roseateles sp.]
MKAAALLITLTALAGCGQKGPLTLPKPAGAASAPASAPAR